jgi:hypothetical protein
VGVGSDGSIHARGGHGPYHDPEKLQSHEEVGGPEKISRLGHGATSGSQDAGRNQDARRVLAEEAEAGDGQRGEEKAADQVAGEKGEEGEEGGAHDAEENGAGDEGCGQIEHESQPHKGQDIRDQTKARRQAEEVASDGDGLGRVGEGRGPTGVVDQGVPPESEGGKAQAKSEGDEEAGVEEEKGQKTPVPGDRRLGGGSGMQVGHYDMGCMAMRGRGVVRKRSIRWRQTLGQGCERGGRGAAFHHHAFHGAGKGPFGELHLCLTMVGLRGARALLHHRSDDRI